MTISKLLFISVLVAWVPLITGAKKRHIDRTTNLDLVGYLLSDRSATWRALSALVVAEVGLSMAHSGTYGLMPTLAELVGALTAGYAADSRFNRAEDQLSHD